MRQDSNYHIVQVCTDYPGVQMGRDYYLEKVKQVLVGCKQAGGELSTSLYCMGHTKYCCTCSWINYPVCICTAGLCVWSHQFVYMYVNKKRLFGALPFENLLLSVICYLLFEFECPKCGLLHPVSCTDRAIHAFPNKMWKPLALKYFLWVLTAHHTL